MSLTPPSENKRRVFPKGASSHTSSYEALLVITLIAVEILLVFSLT
jgi:hypothetical protein